MTNRRGFLKAAPLAALAGAPAVVGAQPAIRWRLASSFPKALDALYAAAEQVAQQVSAATGGRFQIQVFAANELVPPFGVLDAVREGTVECGHSASYYYIGKDPTFAFDCAMPFGLNSRQQSAWLVDGGGMALMRELFAGYNIVNFPCGNTGAQMGGWFRREIRSVADLKGLKMRIGGYAGQVVSRLGVVPQQIPGADVYPALEKVRSTPPSGSARTTTSSWASTRSRLITTTRAGPKPVRSSPSTSIDRRTTHCRPSIGRSLNPPARRPTSACRRATTHATRRR